MKSKIVLSVILLLILVQSSFGQLEKGSFAVGGELGFGNSNTVANQQVPLFVPPGSYTHKNFSIGLSPVVSYFVANRFSIGLITPYSYSRTWGMFPSSWTSNYSAGPSVRYYFPFKTWALFSELSYYHGWQTSMEPVYYPGYSPSTKVTARKDSWSLGAGLTYFITKNIGLEGKLYYEQDKVHPSSYDPITTQSYLNFRIGLQVYLHTQGM
jgi:hypothetical protein